MSSTDELISGRYRVERTLGAGGMGRIDLARDEELDRPVALKRILPERADDFYRERFVQEARVTARLAHPNIVRVFDFGVTDVGELFIVYEFVTGRTLEEILREEGPQLDPVRVARWGKLLSEALVHAHSHEVLHRDLKPSNILIRDDDTPVLCDFGLARDRTPKGLKTETGRMMGTPAFMDPIGLAGGTMTPEGDQYSLAAVLYLAAFGRGPLDTDQLLRAIQRETIEPVSFPALPEGPGRELVEALRPALRFDPGARYPSLEEFARALEGTRSRTRRSSKERSAAPGGTSWAHPLLAILAAGAMLGGFLSTGDPDPAPQPVVEERLEATGTDPKGDALGVLAEAGARLDRWHDQVNCRQEWVPFQPRFQNVNHVRDMGVTLVDRQLDVDVEDWATAAAAWLTERREAARREGRTAFSQPGEQELLREHLLGRTWVFLVDLRDLETLNLIANLTGEFDRKLLFYAERTPGRWNRMRVAFSGVAEALGDPEPEDPLARRLLALLTSLSREESFLPIRRTILLDLERGRAWSEDAARDLTAVIAGLDDVVVTGPATCEERDELLERTWKLMAANACGESDSPACRDLIDVYHWTLYRIGFRCKQLDWGPKAARFAALRKAFSRLPPLDFVLINRNIRWHHQVWSPPAAGTPAPLVAHRKALAELATTGGVTGDEARFQAGELWRDALIEDFEFKEDRKSR